MESLYGHEKFLAGGSAIFVLGKWVVKIDLLANRSTHWPRTPICWPTGRPVGQHLIIGGWVITGGAIALIYGCRSKCDVR